MSRSGAESASTTPARPFIVGAYATLGDTVIESYAATGLRRLQDESASGIGLEIPLYSGFPRWSDADFLLSLGARGSVITLIPALHELATSGAGLAAAERDQRERAMSVVRKAQAFAARLNRKASGTVSAITAISGPSSTQGSVDRGALAESLHALAQDDGALPILIEHCDAILPGRIAAKGYLPLPDEIHAARQSGTLIALNWGRSAIEGRSASTPDHHLAMASEADVLGAVMISGASGKASALGDAWTDVHNPLRESSSLGAPWEHATVSLLTTERARTWLSTAACRETVLYHGMKIGVESDLTLPERFVTLRDGLSRLHT